MVPPAAGGLKTPWLSADTFGSLQVLQPPHEAPVEVLPHHCSNDPGDIVVTETVRQRHTSASLSEMSRANLQKLEAATRQNAVNLQAALDAALYQTMSQGEMAWIVQRPSAVGQGGGTAGLFAGGDQRPGPFLVECGGAGALAGCDVFPAGVTDGRPIDRRTSEAIEVYQPILAEERCLQCHEWKEGQVGGVEVLRVSTSSLRKAGA